MEKFRRILSAAEFDQQLIFPYCPLVGFILATSRTMFPAWAPQFELVVLKAQIAKPCEGKGSSRRIGVKTPVH